MDCSRWHFSSLYTFTSVELVAGYAYIACTITSSLILFFSLAEEIGPNRIAYPLSSIQKT